MTHPLLSNPFRLSPEQTQVRAQPFHFVPSSSRATAACSHCRSDDITSQATVQWSNEKQEWDLASTFAQPAHCNTCNKPTEIVWLPLN